MLKLGSLFDGSGGFPLAGALCGIEPIWASEIEPYPIAVTTSRIPKMKHLGDINKINGADLEPVDIITFGSPCQDLSVAGKRAGLKHENNGDDETTRSGLFIEAVRIIKEMREKTNGEYPRFALWENVPGAFSSNKGEDFRIVLEELVKIVEPTAVMPDVPKFGWPYADSYCGNGWSLAYRVLDAQYWGVPQRRRRIYLVTDFRGQCARKILFEREGLRGYFTEGRTPWKTVTHNAERSVGADDGEGEVPYTLKIRSGVSVDSYGKAAGKGALIQKNLSATLGVSQDQYLFQPVGADPYNGDLTGDKSATLGVRGAEINENGVCPTITAAAGMSGNNQPWICQGVDVYNQSLTGDKSKTLNSVASDADHVPCVILSEVKCYDARGNGDGKTVNTIIGDHENRITDYTSVVVSKETVALEGNGQRPSHHGDGYLVSDKSYTLNTTEVHGVAYEQSIVLDRAFYNQGQNALYDPQYYENGLVPPLVAKGPSAVAYGINGDISGTLDASYYKGCGMRQGVEREVVATPPHYIVRRLTPTECARLQGFADRWGNIDSKTEFSDEEYRFWLEVRNTHAAINGKQVKDYNKKQMLTWYNKLHTDSAEYKMWGNGIALPTALYVMQGISDVIESEEFNENNKN